MDKNKIHIDDWVQKTLADEVDNEGIHSSWEKMSALLDEQDSRPRGLFWQGRRGWMSVLTFILLSAVSGIALWKHSAETVTDRDDSIEGYASSRGVTAPGSEWPHTGRHMGQHTATTGTDVKNHDQKKDHGMIAAVEQADRIARDSHASLAVGREENRKATAAYSQKTASPSVATPLNSDRIFATDAAQRQLAAESVSVPAEHARAIAEIEDAGHQSPVIASSAESHIIDDLKTQYNIDSLKKAIAREIKNRNIAYSTSKKEMGRVKEVKVLEKHEKISYPNAVNDDHRSVSTITQVREYRKMSLIPLSQIEQLVVQSFALELINTENSEEDIRYMNVINTELASHTLAPKSSSSATSGAGGANTRSEFASLMKDINNYFNFRRNFYTTIHMGFNTTPGDWLPLGFQFGAGAHYYIAERFTLGLEGLYNFRNTNFSIEDNQVHYTMLRTGHTGTSGYIDYEEKRSDRQYNVRYLESFQFPFVLTYHTPRISYSLGPVIGFTSPIKYHKFDKENISDKRLFTDTTESLPFSSTDFRYANSDFGRNMLLGINAGINFNLNNNVSITFRYSQMLWDNGKINNVHSIMNQTFKMPEMRLGLQYRLGKSRRVQYMMMPSSRQ